MVEVREVAALGGSLRNRESCAWYLGGLSRHASLFADREKDKNLPKLKVLATLERELLLGLA